MKDHGPLSGSRTARMPRASPDAVIQLCNSWDKGDTLMTDATMEQKNGTLTAAGEELVRQLADRPGR